ncbi:dynactin subunit 1, partial [Oryzias melastigma]|uniref:dynactin subunit 1 n=1 Tax=Oryzias melastigma TaxID=30732 RepID=UPI00168D50B3
MQHKVELERENLTKEGKNLNTLQKHYRNVTIEIEALKHKIKLSGDEHQALLEEYQSLKRDLEQKTKAEVELDGLRRESSSLNNVIDTLKQKIQRQKAELQHLPGHVNSMLSGGTASSYDPQTLSRIVNDERIAVKNLKQEARDLETQLREVEESSTSQRSLRIDLQGVLAERKLVEEYNSKLKMGIQKLQNELKDKSKIEDELVAQRKVLVTLKEEEEEMEKESQSIKAEILDLQLNKSKLADEKQALSKKIQEKTTKMKMEVEVE